MDLLMLTNSVTVLLLTALCHLFRRFESWNRTVDETSGECHADRYTWAANVTQCIKWDPQNPRISMQNTWNAANHKKKSQIEKFKGNWELSKYKRANVQSDHTKPYFCKIIFLVRNGSLSSKKSKISKLEKRRAERKSSIQPCKKQKLICMKHNSNG